MISTEQIKALLNGQAAQSVYMRLSALTYFTTIARITNDRRWFDKYENVMENARFVSRENYPNTPEYNDGMSVGALLQLASVGLSKASDELEFEASFDDYIDDSASSRCKEIIDRSRYILEELMIDSILAAEDSINNKTKIAKGQV